MEKIQLYRPAPEELWFRQRLLGDPETMAYNRAYGGTIPFPRERWAPWYERWVERPEGRFYRYLREVSGGRFVGEAAYHWDDELEEFICDVIVEARYPGQHGVRGVQGRAASGAGGAWRWGRKVCGGDPGGCERDNRVT